MSKEKKEKEAEKNQEKIQNRVNEIISELSDCREDERNSQNQILQVISVAGTVLGILVGASYINTNEPNKLIIIFSNFNIPKFSILNHFFDMMNQNITNARILFWLSMLVFCIAFTYITVLGIDNVLRYFYIQNLEDRLNQLIAKLPDDVDRGDFLHWNAYSAPIVTKNIKHITSSHTLLNYICYVTAICCVILFSIGMVITLYLKINPREWFDTFVLWVMIFFMVIAFLLFLRFSSRADRVSQFAWDTAHENQKIRLKNMKETLYKNAKPFRKRILYFIYPKRQDLQKPLLILAGFIYGLIIAGVGIEKTYIYNFLIAVFVFDFLAYQARYQINDIRGMKEDEESGQNNRLIADDFNEPKDLIKTSFKIAVLKILIALLVTVSTSGSLKILLSISLGILLISTLLYEVARAKKNTRLIYIFVGMGYPLRFFVGFFILPISYSLPMLIQTVCLVLALWAYGSFSSILAWANEVTNRMQEEKKKKNMFPVHYEKKHYMDIQNTLRERYILAEKHIINNKVLPLREKGKLRDAWNLGLLFSLLLLMCAAYLSKISYVLFTIEALAYIIFSSNIFARHKKKMRIMLIGGSCIIMKGIIAIISMEAYARYVFFSMIQICIMATYFILSYQPQYKKISFKELRSLVKYKILEKVLGEHAFNILRADKDKSDAGTN